MSTIRAIDRAFSILRIIAKHPQGVGVNAIAQAVNLPKSTTSRILSTLENREVVSRTEANQFQLGPEVTRLAGQQPFSQNLAILARPILQEIADTTGEAAALCILDDLQVYYLDHVQSQHAVRVRDWTGAHIPLHVVAAGKVFLAYGSDELVAAAVQKPLSAYTNRTITSPQALKAHLAQIRDQGYAIGDEEFEEGVIGLAAPIHDANNQVIAAINVYGPKFRLQEPGRQQEIVTVMVKAAGNLAQKLH